MHQDRPLAEPLAAPRERPRHHRVGVAGQHVRARPAVKDVVAVVSIGGRDYLSFCSNDYLGLANHPRVKQKAQTAIEVWGVGPAAVRTIAGSQALDL